MRRLALIALALWLLPATAVLAAESDDDLCAALDRLPETIRPLYENAREIGGCRSAYWKTFQAKPARDLLDTESFKTYEESLKRQDCDSSIALLTNAFADAYPNAPSILDSSTGYGSGHFWTWRIYAVPANYPELDLCLLMREISEAQAEIEKRGMKVGRFNYEIGDSSYGRLSVPRPVRKREIAVGALLRRDYAPAMLALLELSQEGKIIRLVPEYRYYLLQRLLLLGVKRHHVADMLAAVEARLQPSQMEDLKRQAGAGKYNPLRPMTE